MPLNSLLPQSMNSRNNPPSDSIGIHHLGFSDHDVIIIIIIIIIIMNIKNVSQAGCSLTEHQPFVTVRVEGLQKSSNFWRVLTVLKRVDFSFQPLLRRIHGGRTQSFVRRFRFSTVRCDRTQTHPSRLPIALSETGELYSPIILFLFA